MQYLNRSFLRARVMPVPVSTLGLILFLLSVAVAPGATATLENEVLAVELSETAWGMPYVASATWKHDDSPILTARDPAPVDRWFAPELLDKPSAETTWKVFKGPTFHRAEATRALRNGLLATWAVELHMASATLRMGVRLKNSGEKIVFVPTFPAWLAAWHMPGCADKMTWWKSLTFEREEAVVSTSFGKSIASRVHSSDTREGGVNPYWMLTGRQCTAHFSLDWCGGWQATFSGDDGGLAYAVTLPRDETQLNLQAGEEIAGPVLNVFFTEERDEAAARAAWHNQRINLARDLYGAPAPSYPFSWNHWYAVRFDVNGDFIDRQVEACAPYGFDYFVVDAGWYKGCGAWVPNPAKFVPGQFESAMASLAERGVRPGIWTCPQFVQADPNALPPEVDRPGFYRDFIDGHLLDMAGMDFKGFLRNHVKALREHYKTDWWKYDQDFFTENDTRHGRMKNVVAFQEALRAVRIDHPDLYIENCQSGGRMLNEFTVLLAQGQWICDGSGGGRTHARDNLERVLGALEFLPPSSAIRWINRPDEIPPEKDELLRMYCRSAMPGVWGVVADLSRIGPRQRDIIVRERDHYRRLNALKADNLYDLYPTSEEAPAAGVVYFSKDGRHAAVLLLRWNINGAFDFPIALDKLNPAPKFAVNWVDDDDTVIEAGRALTNDGLTVVFKNKQHSALVFVDAAVPRSL